MFLRNVKGLYKTQKHREFYEKLKGRLERSGYVLFDAVENAIEYGAPQYRERLFLIGFRKKVFGIKSIIRLEAIINISK